MKYILFFSILFVSVVKGQDTAYKKYSDSTGEYKIRYIYDGSIAMIPLTLPPGSPHYENAEVVVFKKIKHRFEQIGTSFYGTYVPTGCFEDIAEDKIKEAYKTIKPKP